MPSKNLHLSYFQLPSKELSYTLLLDTLLAEANGGLLKLLLDMEDRMSSSDTRQLRIFKIAKVDGLRPGKKWTMVMSPRATMAAPI